MFMMFFGIWEKDDPNDWSTSKNVNHGHGLS